MAYEEYIGRRVKEDFEDLAEPILSKGGAEFDCIEDYEIPVIMLHSAMRECLLAFLHVYAKIITRKKQKNEEI